MATVFADLGLAPPLLEAAVKEDGLEPYLTLVEELAEEGLDVAEIAAAAARLARAGKPLDMAAEREPAPPATAADGGMVRLFVDAGREAGVRPADIVGAIAGEAGISGQAIGSIDLYDRFTFVEVPSESAEHVLAAMRHVKIRNRPVRVKVATPRGYDVGPGTRRRGGARRSKGRRVA
jgi:ATP-dependent RNA helicase DeaD